MATKRSASSVLDEEAGGDEPLFKRTRVVSSPAADVVLRLDIPKISSHLSVPQAPLFQHPYQLTSFSYNAKRELKFDNSSLNYYVDAPLGADLSYRYESWIKRPEERGRLDGLLETCLRKEVKYERERAEFVSWRGVMTKILTAPYEERDGFELNAMKLNGTIYLEEHLNDVRLKEKENMTSRQRLQSYYGYAFESYSSSSTPDPGADKNRKTNGWSGDVNTNVQWCSVVKTKLGDMRLLIGGEVDCVRGKYTGQPDTFVELKTTLAIRNAQDEARFEKKLLKFYFQSFLLGVPEIVIGFRSGDGRITTIQSFQTIQIPRMVRGKADAWDPNICLDWGSRFMSFLKSNLSDTAPTLHHEVEVKVWRIVFKPGLGVEMYLLNRSGLDDVRDGEDRVGFLPRSYWNEVIGTSSYKSKEDIPSKAVEQSRRTVETALGFVL